MASSLGDWLHRSLSKYADEHGTDLGVRTRGQKMQILKWHRYEEPYWATVGDKASSILARFTKEAVEAYTDDTGKRVTELKSAIIHIKSFSLEMVSPYKRSAESELAIVVHSFVAPGMDDEEIHFAETRRQLKGCGGELGEWIQGLRSSQPVSTSASQLALPAGPSMPPTEPPAPKVDAPVTTFVRPARGRLQPTAEQMANAPIREATLEELMGTVWWKISKEEQARQDAEPERLADGPSTEDCIARDLAFEAAQAKLVSPPTPPPNVAPAKRAISPSLSSDEDDEMPVKKPRTSNSKLSPIPTSSPPRAQAVAEPASQTKSPPSSARTATHSSPPSQQPPARKSRSQSGLRDGKAKNALRADGSKVLVDASDDEQERAQEKQDEEDVLSSLEEDPGPTPGQRSRLQPPASQPLPSSGADVDVTAEAGPMDVDEADEAAETAVFYTLEQQLSGETGPEPTATQLGKKWALDSPQSDKPAVNDGRDGRPNMMMRRTGHLREPSPSYTQESDLMLMQSGEKKSHSTTEDSGSQTQEPVDPVSSGIPIDSSDERAGFKVGRTVVQIEEEPIARPGDDEPIAEDDEEVEEVPRSIRSSPDVGDVLSHVPRPEDESESVSFEKDDNQAIRQASESIAKHEQQSQALPASSHAEDEVESPAGSEEGGDLNAHGDNDTATAGDPVESGSTSPSRHLQHPSSSPAKRPSPTSPEDRLPLPSRTTREPAETPDRPPVPRAQGPPPSSGAFRVPQSSAVPSTAQNSRTPKSEASHTSRPVKRVRSPTATPPVRPTSKPATAMVSAPTALSPSEQRTVQKGPNPFARPTTPASAAHPDSAPQQASAAAPSTPKPAGLPPTVPTAARQSVPPTTNASSSSKAAARPAEPAASPVRETTSPHPTSVASTSAVHPGNASVSSTTASGSVPPTSTFTIDNVALPFFEGFPSFKKRKSLGVAPSARVSTPPVETVTSASRRKLRESLNEFGVSRSEMGSERSESPAVGARRDSSVISAKDTPARGVEDGPSRLRNSSADVSSHESPTVAASASPAKVVKKERVASSSATNKRFSSQEPTSTAKESRATTDEHVEPRKKQRTGNGLERSTSSSRIDVDMEEAVASEQIETLSPAPRPRKKKSLPLAPPPFFDTPPPQPQAVAKVNAAAGPSRPAATASSSLVRPATASAPHKNALPGPSRTSATAATSTVQPRPTNAAAGPPRLPAPASTSAGKPAAKNATAGPSRPPAPASTARLATASASKPSAPAPTSAIAGPSRLPAALTSKPVAHKVPAAAPASASKATQSVAIPSHPAPAPAPATDPTEPAPSAPLPFADATKVPTPTKPAQAAPVAKSKSKSKKPKDPVPTVEEIRKWVLWKGASLG